MNNITNDYIKSLACGPMRCVSTFNGCKINGYRFQTIAYGSERSTSNIGVCIKGETYGEDEYDYYGRLLEVVRLEYSGSLSTILFKCEWFDPTPTGTRVHAQYKLVDINHKRRFNRYEPFVLASQAIQVYYCPYPSLKRDMVDWLAACKIKARSTIDFIEENTPIDQSFQEDVVQTHAAIEVEDVDFRLDDQFNDIDEFVDDGVDDEILDNEDGLIDEQETNDS